MPDKDRSSPDWGDSRISVGVGWYGLEGIPKGWYAITDILIEDLFTLGWDGTLYQAKSKFASGRFYTGGRSEGMDERIKAWAGQTSETCEVCGNPGITRTKGGWYETMCAEHANTYGKKK